MDRRDQTAPQAKKARIDDDDDFDDMDLDLDIEQEMQMEAVEEQLAVLEGDAGPSEEVAAWSRPSFSQLDLKGDTSSIGRIP